MQFPFHISYQLLFNSIEVFYSLLYNHKHHLYNILTRAAGGRALTRSETLRKVVIIMSTYEELQLIVSVAVLIVAILTYVHKK